METLDLACCVFDWPLPARAALLRQRCSWAARSQRATPKMQRLEEKIGQCLFEKHGRQKRLTDPGGRLLGYARHLLAVHDEALRDLQHRQVQGLVRIDTPHDAADNMLPPVLKEIAQSPPGLQADIHVGQPFPGGIAEAGRTGHGHFQSP